MNSWTCTKCKTGWPEELNECPVCASTPKELPEELLTKLRKWLTPNGIRFFKELKEKYGTILAVYMEGSIPHPVHLREGMQIRNWMREQAEFKDFTAHDYDNFWSYLIERAIEGA